MNLWPLLSDIYINTSLHHRVLIWKWDRDPRVKTAELYWWMWTIPNLDSNDLTIGWMVEYFILFSKCCDINLNFWHLYGDYRVLILSSVSVKPSSAQKNRRRVGCAPLNKWSWILSRSFNYFHFLCCARERHRHIQPRGNDCSWDELF